MHISIEVSKAHNDDADDDYDDKITMMMIILVVVMVMMIKRLVNWLPICCTSYYPSEGKIMISTL